MHITVDHIKLQNLLERVARVSTKHLTLPALQCVLLDVKENTLTIRATNLEIGIEGTIAVDVKEEGTVSVIAQTFLQIVSLISQKDVTLHTEGDVLIVETKTSRTTIHTITAQDFPHIPKVEGKGQVIKGTIFANAVKTAAFAASQSSIKPELGSVYVFQKKEHTLTCVATDSFRLVEKTVSQQNVVLEEGILIPAKNALELARLCDSQDDDPMLYITENQCALQFENIYITSRLTSGTFPDYAQIIPKEFVSHSTLLTQDLQNALKKTSIFLNKFMQLTIAASAQNLTLTSKGDVGTTTEKTPASLEGDEISLNFNQRYIADILGYITDESITIHFAGTGRPIIIESVHDKSLRYLVMPMNK
ncbi:DNA polymerase III subunit beta [Candidatus Parcubacteria bacterium]|uniref:Beta sliding clamp n=1 Tax=Candidatus Kaiserbacteria bacterium CG10_big_fil_rev_8_21_14_0_10_47_16 TaxID=1974608 RepID=A0A2H0UDY6_9BACT|nr:DNA polymerase III subunit beta [Candidatus Parcubacteria bacterium]PIR84619.1 MAG: DNA polymerase III subunit beta [Candidatus Kaiserbacteria bacterium CG10_big_fil_rev_8_21_14_0_10_47_16]